MKLQDHLARTAKVRPSAKNAFWGAGGLLLALGGLGIIATPAAIADKPALQIISNASLRFGTFAVPTQGYREVSAYGAVSGSGIFAMSNGGTGPARFTVQYDRGNNGRRRMDLTIELVLSPAPVFSNGGLIARLTRYQTDLPGYAMVDAGQVIRIEMPNCVQRVCATTFNVGGRLDVERSFGGGRVDIPIPVDAVLVSVN